MATDVYKPQVLVVDDNANTRKLIRKALEKSFSIMEAENGKNAVQVLHDQDPPDLILLDIIMPEMNGYEVFEQVRSNPRIANIPIIFLTALDGQVEKIKGLDAGAVDYITKPFLHEVLLVRIEAALELHAYLRGEVDDIPELPADFPFVETQEESLEQPDNLEPAGKPTILSVDDNKDIRNIIQRKLSTDYNIVTCSDAAETFTYLENNPNPDLILLDISLPDRDGFEIIAQIKSDSATTSIPVIFLTSHNETNDEIRGFQAGAADYVRKPIDIQVLRARLRNHLLIDKRRKEFEARLQGFADSPT